MHERLHRRLQAMQEAGLTAKRMSSPPNALGSPAQWGKALVVLTWALFVVAIVLLDWQQASSLQYFINSLGAIGLVVALLWLMFDGKWKTAVMVVSVALVGVYALRWGAHVASTYSTSPELGYWGAIDRLGELLAARFSWQKEKLGLSWAVLHVYWDALILPVQLVVIGYLVWLPTRSRSERDA
jgi:hypothetical protein